MESAVLIWFFAMLFGSGVVVGYNAGQKEEQKKNSTSAPVVVDAGTPEAWRGNSSSSTRTYWDTPVPRVDQLP